MVHWVYRKTIVSSTFRPSLFWWHKPTLGYVASSLSKAQKIVCLGITRCMPSKSTATMTTIRLRPLNLMWLEAILGTYSIKCSACKSFISVEHFSSLVWKFLLGIAKILFLLDVVLTPKLIVHLFRKIIGGKITIPKILVDSQKKLLENGQHDRQIGQLTIQGTVFEQQRGWCLWKTNFSRALQTSLTISQVEIHTIDICVQEKVGRAPRGANIYIFTDWLAVLKALDTAVRHTNTKYIEVLT